MPKKGIGSGFGCLGKMGGRIMEGLTYSLLGQTGGVPLGIGGGGILFLRLNI